MCEVKNYLPVDSVFVYHKVQLQVVEGNSCSLCYFFCHKEKHCFDENLNDVPPCSGFVRSDDKDVFFKKVQI